MNPTDYLERIVAAKRPFDLFGELAGTPDEQRKRAREIFRRLAKATHTDKVDDARAKDAFVRLKELYDLAVEAIRKGTYGATRPPIVVRTKRGRYEIDPDPVFAGDATDYFAADFFSDEGGVAPVFVKLARFPGDNAIVEKEAATLRELLAHERAKRDTAFFPEVLDRFSVRAGSTKRSALVVGRGVERWYSLEDVGRRFPDGIDPKDVAWMARRLLYALGVAHTAGFVHGAVGPEHVLIQPELHGLVLVDWKYAVRIGERIARIPKGTRDRYPPEVVEKKDGVGPATDIYLATRTLNGLLGRYPRTGAAARLEAFFRGSSQAAAALRPQDAFGLLVEFDELIGRLWGERRFHPFSME